MCEALLWNSALLVRDQHMTNEPPPSLLSHSLWPAGHTRQALAFGPRRLAATEAPASNHQMSTRGGDLHQGARFGAGWCQAAPCF